MLPFRSNSKLSAEARAAGVVTHIPKWSAKKAASVSLHHMHGPRTWMCDHLFIKGDGEVINGEPQQSFEVTELHAVASTRPNFDDASTKTRSNQTSGLAPVCILLAFLHCNSRLFQAYIVNDKSLHTFSEKVRLYLVPRLPYETHFPDWIRNNNLSMMDTLLCDYAFNKKGLNTFLQQRGVTMISKNIKRTKDHGFLSPIDRMARTLRDMIFNAKRTEVLKLRERANPKFMFNADTLKKLCAAYNSAPHATLSQIMGFKVTPNDVFWNLDLQDEIVRRTYLQNYKIINSPAFNSIHVGDIVYLHKPRQFGEKRRLNVEDTPYKVISLNPISIENVVTHEVRSEGIHRKYLVQTPVRS